MSVHGKQRSHNRILAYVSGNYVVLGFLVADFGKLYGNFQKLAVSQRFAALFGQHTEIAYRGNACRKVAVFCGNVVEFDAYGFLVDCKRGVVVSNFVIIYAVFRAAYLYQAFLNAVNASVERFNLFSVLYVNVVELQFFAVGKRSCRKRARSAVGNIHV